MAARRQDGMRHIFNHDLPPSPPPRPSLRVQPLVDAQAAGIGRGRYGLPPSGMQNKQQYQNPVLQPINNNQLNQRSPVDREAERLREAYRMLQQRPQSPRAVLEPLAQGGGQAVRRTQAQVESPPGASGEQLEFLRNQVNLSVSKVGNRVNSVEDIIASLGKAVVQSQKDIQQLDANKRGLEKEIQDSRVRLEQGEISRQEAGKDSERLNYKIDSVSSALGAQRIEMQTFKSQLLGDSALLEKLREATGDTVQVTAEQIATLNKRVGDVMRNLQLLTQSFAEEVKERKALEQESRIQYTNAEAGLVQTESNILRRVLAVVEAQSKEILRKVTDGDALAEERHSVHKAALEEQWKLIVNKEALEKKTIIERMLILEKALREEHESRTYSERMIKDYMDNKNDEVGKALDLSRGDVKENIEYLRKQLVGAFQRMEGLLTETDQTTTTKVKELENIVKLEVKARMKAIRKLNGIWHESFSEVNKVDGRITKVENTIQEVENAVTDLVVGDVTNNLLETSIQELHVEDMSQQVSDMDDKVVKVKEMLLQEFDSLKDLQEVSKRRQDTSIEQMRSELSLKNTTIALRFDELKAQVDKVVKEVAEKEPNRDGEEIEKQKMRLDELKQTVDEINEKTGVSVQNVEDMDTKVESMGSKVLEVRKLLLNEFDSLKTFQDASKKRQDNSIEQLRSEYNLNKVTSGLRIDELKTKLADIGDKIESIEMERVYGPAVLETKEEEKEKAPESDPEEDTEEQAEESDNGEENEEGENLIAKEEEAAVKIQSRARVMLAKKKVDRIKEEKKKLKEEEEEARKEEEPSESEGEPEQPQEPEQTLEEPPKQPEPEPEPGPEPKKNPMDLLAELGKAYDD